MKTFQESAEIKLKFSLPSSGGKSESIYFDGDKYEFVERWATNVVETEEECMNEKYDVSTKDRYYFTGRFCKFLGSKDKDYGYKIFMDENLEERHIRLLFEIQDLLSENGFAPRPLEIIKCNEDSREYFAIKMDNIKGTHVQPDQKWINNLVDFCNENKIHRQIRNVANDCIPKNCIKTDDGKIYLVDIDQRYRYEKFDMEYLIPRVMALGRGISHIGDREAIYVDGIRLFDSIQIQTIEFCNLKCDFCPNHYIIWDRIEDKKRGIPYNLMTVENYTKIVKNLANLGFKGRFSPYLMNEPLIDKDRIVEFIRIAREYLPDCFIQIDTNGTGFTEELMRAMMDAGLNRVQIDDYFNDAYAERMFEIMMEFQEEDVKIILSSNYNVKQVKKKEDKNKEIHWAPYTYWNRGGLVNVNPDMPIPQIDCGYPSSQMYIKWNGEALLCCCDWEYQVVHGNVLGTSIEEVWTNGSYEHYRKTLKKGRRDLLQMCRKCNKGGESSYRSDLQLLEEVSQ